MNDIQQKTLTVLQRITVQLREAPSMGDFAIPIERLMGQVEQPCVVAVVGRMKAGKSTFINTLLGENLAKVGVTETTATINYFCYGNADPARSVRCHWRNGRITEETPAFLDSLQGNDLETLRRAEGIAYLEYFLPNPVLKQITLVDTPGTGAVVSEHQNRTAEFMGLVQQLRERHDQDSQRLGNTADAVIYLIGPVARTTDQAFLEEFAQATGGQSRAFNAVGVMAKIDLQSEIVQRRHTLADKIASQLKDALNTVVPISAALHQAHDHLLAHDQAGLTHLLATLRRIPPARLDMLLDSEEFFRDFESDDCPVTTVERQALLGDMPWGCFATIARAAADPTCPPTAVLAYLQELSGFAALKKSLEQNFFQRGHILRCYRILNDVRKVLNQIKFTHFPAQRRRDRENQGRLERFQRFIRQTHGEPAVAQELEDFVCQQLHGAGQAPALEQLWNQLDRELSTFFHELMEYNVDFEALQQLEDHTDMFSPAECDELRGLLGLYGLEVDKRLQGNVSAAYVQQQQLGWKQKETEAPHGTVRRGLAQRAYTRYGFILYEVHAR